MKKEITPPPVGNCPRLRSDVSEKFLRGPGPGLVFLSSPFPSLLFLTPASSVPQRHPSGFYPRAFALPVSTVWNELATDTLAACSRPSFRSPLKCLLIAAGLPHLARHQRSSLTALALGRVCTKLCLMPHRLSPLLVPELHVSTDVACCVHCCVPSPQCGAWHMAGSH